MQPVLHVPFMSLILDLLVVHPLAPEKWRVCEDNKEGCIKSPMSLTMGNVSHALGVGGGGGVLWFSRCYVASADSCSRDNLFHIYM